MPIDNPVDAAALIAAHTALEIAAAVHGNTHMAKAYLGTDFDDVPSGRIMRVELDTVEYDPGGNFDLSTWYDEVQADADSDATHIEDDDGSFTLPLYYVYVTWASDSPPTANIGTGYVTAVDADTLTIVKASGADFGANYYYKIMHADYLVSVDGYHRLDAAVEYEWGTVVANKRYEVWACVDASLKVKGSAHSSNTDNIVINASTPTHLTAGQRAYLTCRQNAGVDTVDIESTGRPTFLAVTLIQAD